MIPFRTHLTSQLRYCWDWEKSKTGKAWLSINSMSLYSFSYYCHFLGTLSNDVNTFKTRWAFPVHNQWGMKLMKSWVLCWWLFKPPPVIWGLGQHVDQVGTVWAACHPVNPFDSRLSWGPGGGDEGPPCRPAPAPPERTMLAPWSAAVVCFQGFMRIPCAQFECLGRALESVKSLPRSWRGERKMYLESMGWWVAAEYFSSPKKLKIITFHTSGFQGDNSYLNVWKR